jgi:hypothetical protein
MGKKEPISVSCPRAGKVVSERRNAFGEDDKKSSAQRTATMVHHKYNNHLPEIGRRLDLDFAAR